MGRLISIIVSVQRKKDRAKGIAITSAQIDVYALLQIATVGCSSVSKKWQNIQTSIIGSTKTKRNAKANTLSAVLCDATLDLSWICVQASLEMVEGELVRRTTRSSKMMLCYLS
jgi:hypothetical protein